MRKASRKRRRREDSSQSAHRILQAVINKTERVPEPPTVEITPEMRAVAAAFGRLGGMNGGLARAKNLSAEERSAAAKKAAKARWKAKKPK
jgi:hypothetical protein